MNTNPNPSLRPIKMDFNRGVWSVKDASLIPPNAIASGVNIQITDQWGPSKCLGRQKYNASEVGSSVPVKGGIAWIAEDGKEYIVIACNNKLYWSNGNGSFTYVLYLTEAVAVTLDTANHFFSFVEADKTAKKVVYVTTDVYPIATNANGTANKKCTTSLGLKLTVSGTSTIVCQNIYAGTGGGADDIAVGNGSTTVSFPQAALLSCKVLNRVLYANIAGATGGWQCSEAADPENMTNSSVSSNTGGGLYPEPYTAVIPLDSRVFFWTRNSLAVLNVVPGPISSWREYLIPTTLGNVGQQVALHSDGWVYYVSPQGIARTNGSIAERVDYDIEDNIEGLSQLIQNLYSVTINSTAQFNAGTPSSGDNVLDTSSATLKQKSNFTNIPNPSFENPIGGGISVLNNWTAVGASWARLGGGYTGNYAVIFDTSFSSTPGNFVFTVKILDGTGATILTYTPSITSASYTEYTIPAGDLTAYQGTNIKIQFYVNTTAASTFTSDTFAYTAGDLGFYYKYWFPTGTETSIWLDTLYNAQIFDFGVAPSTYGSLAANIGPSGTADFYISTSTNGTSWGAYASIGSATTAGNYSATITATPLRYCKIKPLPGAGVDPIISSVVIGAKWISAIQDLTITPMAYGVFSTLDTPLGQTLTYEMNTSPNSNMSSSDGYVAVTSGAVPTNTLRRYVQFRVSFNTTDYTALPYLNGITLNYALGTTSASKPAVFSYKDKVYCSFTSNGATANDHVWVAETKLVQGIQYTPSLLTGMPYPQWSKRDFPTDNFYFIYSGNLMAGSSIAGFVDFKETGTTNRGTAFTSYFTTGAINIDDVSILIDFLYLYYMAAASFSIQWRTRIGQGDWSDYSTAITLPPAPNASRSDKTTLPGITMADYYQFKISTTATDALWAISHIAVYLAQYSQGA